MCYSEEIEGIKIGRIISYELIIEENRRITFFDDTRKDLKEDFSELKKLIDNSSFGSILKDKLYSQKPSGLKLLFRFFSSYQPKKEKN